MKLRDRNIILLFLVSDLVILNFSMGIVSLAHHRNLWILPELGIIMNISWILTFLPFINEKLFVHHTMKSRIKDLAFKAIIYLAISSLSIVLLDLDHISRVIYFGSFLLFSVLKYFISYFSDFIVKNKQKGEHYMHVLIVGATKLGKEVEGFYKKNPDRGDVIGYLDDTKENSQNYHILGKLSDFESVINNNEINDVIICLNSLDDFNVKKIIKRSEYNGIRPRVVPDYYALFNRNYEVRKLGHIPIVNIREVRLDYYSNRFWKRAFDLWFSVSALGLLLPLLIMIAIAIKIDSRGPVFYCPLRAGKRGIPFRVYKFRSMKNDENEPDGKKSTVLNDQRITRIGRFIRKYSLDELPQLLNVFLNKMSIVGPRPHRINLNSEFRKNIYTYNVRQYIRPGITGWAQVNGWRGPTNTKLDFYGRTLHDIWYIENWSFALDIYIIYLTVFGKNVRKNAF